MGDHASDVRAGLNVEHVVDMARLDVLTPEERRALLDALDAVPRSASWQHVDCEECGGTCGNAAAYYEERWGEAEARAERAERERDEAVARAELAEADRNKAIDAYRAEVGVRERVKADNDRLLAVACALSADADADAEPEPWEHLRVPYEGDAATAGELTVASEHPDGTCAFCDQRRDADAEPERRSPHVGYKSRIEYRPEDLEPTPWETPEDASRISVENMARRGFHHDFGCTHDPCECSGEPSRAEGDAHAFAPVDTSDAVDRDTCHRCGEGRFHPSHLDPREGLDPDEQLQSLNELSDEWGLCRPPCTKPAGHQGRCNADAHPGTAERWQAIARWWLDKDAEGGRPREADPQGNSPVNGDASVDAEGDDGRSRAREAIVSAICENFGDGTPILDCNIPAKDLADSAIDAALASGHVVTREQYARDTAFIRAQVNARQDRAREDAKRWEAIIRDLDPYCPTGCGVCPDCRALQVVERAGQEADRA